VIGISAEYEEILHIKITTFLNETLLCRECGCVCCNATVTKMDYFPVGAGEHFSNKRTEAARSCPQRRRGPSGNPTFRNRRPVPSRAYPGALIVDRARTDRGEETQLDC